MLAIMVVSIILVAALYLMTVYLDKSARNKPGTRRERSADLEPLAHTEFAEEISVLPEMHTEFPKYPEFGQDYVVLLARDPEYLFAYWEVTFYAVEAYARDTGARDLPEITLRLHDASSPQGSRYHDISVKSRVGNYYMKVPCASTAFYAEIGFLGAAGFWVVSCSQIAQVPAALMSRALAHTHPHSEYARKAKTSIGTSS